MGRIDLAEITIRLDPGTRKHRDGREVTMTNTVDAVLLACAPGKAAADHVFTRPNGFPVREFRDAWTKRLADAIGALGIDITDLFLRLRRQTPKSARQQKSDQERSAR